MTALALQVPEALGFLYEPSRYKVAYGGRGAAKSWAFADALICKALQGPARILCCREHMASMKDSVHQLIKDRINVLGLSTFFETPAGLIKGHNGSIFSFTGLRINPEDLKSYEGYDVAWIEEARNASKKSLDILTPTIRKDGSEIWISFNPELETDEVYSRYVTHKPDDCVSREVSYKDNPWFNKVLESERLACLKRDPDGYLTIWEGKCRVALEGAVYAKEMRELIARGAVLSVPYERSKPVHTAWDLGWGDSTAIILFQQVGYEIRILHYIEDRHKEMPDYVQMLKSLPYIYGHHYLPHDGANRSVLSKFSAEDQLVNLMSCPRGSVHIIPASDDITQHAAVRDLMSKCVFDSAGTSELRNRLASYRYGHLADGSTTRTPIHDASSHGAKAFAYLAMGYDKGHDRLKVKTGGNASTGNTGWMAS